MSWFFLASAIVLEVVGTMCLKLSHGLARPVPALAVVVCYGLSFWAIALALRQLDLGVAYAIWAGLGTALVAVLGMICFGEAMPPLRVISLALIILGVAGLNLEPNHNESEARMPQHVHKRVNQTRTR